MSRSKAQPQLPIEDREVAMEMILGQFNLIHYYSNHTLVLGVPLPSLVQNGGMFAVVGFATRLRGRRRRGMGEGVGAVAVAVPRSPGACGRRA